MNNKIMTLITETTLTLDAEPFQIKKYITLYLYSEMYTYRF